MLYSQTKIRINVPNILMIVTWIYNLVCVRGADFRKAFKNETPATRNAIAALGARRAPAKNRNLPPSPYLSLSVDTASETAACPPGAWHTFVNNCKYICVSYSFCPKLQKINKLSEKDINVSRAAEFYETWSINACTLQFCSAAVWSRAVESNYPQQTDGGWLYCAISSRACIPRVGKEKTSTSSSSRACAGL